MSQPSGDRPVTPARRPGLVGAAGRSDLHRDARTRWPAPTRRAVLGGALLIGIAGCEDDTHSSTRDPDTPIRERSAIGKRALLERYRATVDRHPDLAKRLSTLVADHEAHLVALTRAPLPTASPRAPLLPSPLASPSAEPSAPAVPGDTATALQALAGAERQASDQRAEDVLAASPLLARLLAAIAACEAVHAVTLEKATEEAP